MESKFFGNSIVRSASPFRRRSITFSLSPSVFMVLTSIFRSAASRNALKLSGSFIIYTIDLWFSISSTCLVARFPTNAMIPTIIRTGSRKTEKIIFLSLKIRASSFLYIVFILRFPLYTFKVFEESIFQIVSTCLLQNFGKRSLCSLFPVNNNPDPVAELFCLGHNMGRDYNKLSFFFQFSQIVSYTSRCDDIKSVRRLVKNHHFRIMNQADCNGRFLFHTRGKLFDLFMRKVINSKICK